MKWRVQFAAVYVETESAVEAEVTALETLVFNPHTNQTEAEEVEV